MTSATSTRLKQQQATGNSSSANEKRGGQTLDLSPQDLKRYLSQPVRSIFHEQAKSIIAIQELQHEVSSLLEFKNALLETFPHLQSRMSASSTALATSHLSGSTGELANSARRLSTLDHHGLGGSTGQLNQTGRLLHHRHVDVVSSDDTQPSWSGIQNTQVNSNGQASSSGVYSGPPGSNNVGSLGRSVMRRLHDSGFSPEASRPHMMWSASEAAMDPEDELMYLLDLIQAKSERLKSELALDPSSPLSKRGLQAINEDEVTEVEQLRRERLLLLQRVAELESGAISGQSSASKKEGNVSAGESESSISGIVHSVHIRTGQEGQQAQATLSSLKRTSTRSISQSDLLLSQNKSDQPGNSVHIEIKNMSRSQDHLASSSRLRSSTSSSRRSSIVSSNNQPSVSVVNLKPASVENLPQQVSNPGGKTRYLSPNRQSFSQLPTKTQILRPNNLLPGRMVMGIKARTSNNKLKSHSVENLIDPGSTVLGLKSANSEMNMVQMKDMAIRRRLSGTTSELNMTRIGTSEKIKVIETLEGVTSLPAELTKGLKGQVKPNRDKIRTILSMNNVIELQRHLLTTVMENEVYKTQLERVSEGWHSRISNFERLNSSLRSSLSELQAENNELKTMVNKKVSELDSTKARLRLLEQSVVNEKPDAASSEQQSTTTTTTKSENHRVHFDLNNATTSAEIRKPARTSRPNGAVATRPNSVHLPSDAKQKLEQLASAAGVSVVNQAPIRLGSPIRTSNLDPIQEMSAPASGRGQQPKRPTSSLPLNGHMLHNNNNNKQNGGNHSPLGHAGSTHRVRRESLGSTGRSRPTTPSGRDVRALNLSNLSKSHPTVEMPTEQASPVDLMNSMDKKDSLLAEDLSRMGRETIAGLIAGIIQRNSIPSERRPREAFVESETETEFTEVTLSPNKEDLPAPAKKTLLFHKRFTPSNFHSLPHTSMNKTSSNFGQVSSWEANNLMEEMTTHNSHIIQARSSSSVTMELDSLSARSPMVHEEDSLNFDLQEVAEEDSLTDENYYEHDSLQPVKPGKDKKKLIIPYNESFSSSNSIFTTSQDGSLDSCTKNQTTTEEDSLTQSNLTLNMVPIKPWPAADTYNHPKIIGPEYQPVLPPPPTRTVNPVVQVQHQAPIQASMVPAPQPSSSPSLMKMATERMKRKFLGWS